MRNKYGKRQKFLSLIITSLAMTYCLEVDVNYNIAVQKDLAGDEALSISHKILDKEVSNIENYVVNERVENPSEGVHSSLGKHYV